MTTTAERMHTYLTDLAAEQRAAADLARFQGEMRDAATRNDAAAFDAANESATRARAAVMGLPDGYATVSAGIVPISEAGEAWMGARHAYGRAERVAFDLSPDWRSPGGATAAYVLSCIAEEHKAAEREYRAASDTVSHMGRVRAATRATEHAATATRLADLIDPKG